MTYITLQISCKVFSNQHTTKRRDKYLKFSCKVYTVPVAEGLEPAGMLESEQVLAQLEIQQPVNLIQVKLRLHLGLSAIKKIKQHSNV